MNIMPNPSPSHHTTVAHTNDTASAGLTVRRDSSPRPMAICTSANNVLNNTCWECIVFAAQLTLSATHGG
jgi:hypothetical protein